MLDQAAAAENERVGRARNGLDRAVELVERAGADASSDAHARRAASALYDAASAALLVWEGARLGGDDGERRFLLADLVLEWRLASTDPADAHAGLGDRAGIAACAFSDERRPPASREAGVWPPRTCSSSMPPPPRRPRRPRRERNCSEPAHATSEARRSDLMG